MIAKSSAAVVASQANSAARARLPVGPNSLSAGQLACPDELLRRLLRTAIDRSAWKHAALASALRVEADYLSKMLAGTKPITTIRLAMLPREVKVAFVMILAEHFGLLVIVPAPREDAARQFAAGLLGLLAPKACPDPDLVMAKATLR